MQGLEELFSESEQLDLGSAVIDTLLWLLSVSDLQATLYPATY